MESLQPYTMLNIQCAPLIFKPLILQFSEAVLQGRTVAFHTVPKVTGAYLIHIYIHCIDRAHRE